MAFIGEIISRKFLEKTILAPHEVISALLTEDQKRAKEFNQLVGSFVKHEPNELAILHFNNTDLGFVKRSNGSIVSFLKQSNMGMDGKFGTDLYVADNSSVNYKRIPFGTEFSLEKDDYSGSKVGSDNLREIGLRLEKTIHPFGVSKSHT